MIDAVKQGQELEALVTALHATQDRRRTLERELATLDSATVPGPAGRDRLRTKLS